MDAAHTERAELRRDGGRICLRAMTWTWGVHWWRSVCSCVAGDSLALCFAHRFFASSRIITERVSFETPFQRLGPPFLPRA